jgi:hypothetical protein
MMEAASTTEMSVNFCQTAPCYIAQKSAIFAPHILHRNTSFSLHQYVRATIHFSCSVAQKTQVLRSPGKDFIKDPATVCHVAISQQPLLCKAAHLSLLTTDTSEDRTERAIHRGGRGGRGGRTAPVPGRYYAKDWGWGWGGAVCRSADIQKSRAHTV